MFCRGQAIGLAALCLGAGAADRRPCAVVPAALADSAGAAGGRRVPVPTLTGGFAQ